MNYAESVGQFQPRVAQPWAFSSNPYYLRTLKEFSRSPRNHFGNAFSVIHSRVSTAATVLITSRRCHCVFTWSSRAWYFKLGRPAVHSTQIRQTVTITTF